jgi:hypothetical protein
MIVRESDATRGPHAHRRGRNSSGMGLLIRTSLVHSIRESLKGGTKPEYRPRWGAWSILILRCRESSMQKIRRACWGGRSLAARADGPNRLESWPRFQWGLFPTVR